MSTLFSYTNAKGANPLWPAIQYIGVRQMEMLAVKRLHALLLLTQADLPCMAIRFEVHLKKTDAPEPPYPAVSGPDAKRPAHPCEDKRRSEEMLCAAILDLNDYNDTASLQQALASLPQMPAEVLTTNPHSGPKSLHNMLKLWDRP